MVDFRSERNDLPGTGSRRHRSGPKPPAGGMTVTALFSDAWPVSTTRGSGWGSYRPAP